MGNKFSYFNNFLTIYVNKKAFKGLDTNSVFC